MTVRHHVGFWGSLWVILEGKLVFFCFLTNHNESKVFLLVCVVCQNLSQELNLTAVTNNALVDLGEEVGAGSPSS